MASKVYFTNLRTRPGMNLLDKLERLVKKAGIEKIDFKDKFVAIKIHFGEPGNLAYIRPNYAARIVALIKKLGGKPFLTDANTLYSGKRSNALDHIQSAYENGFNPHSTGCHVIIADGLKGTDYVEVPINLHYCKTAKIGTVIMDSDVIISMAHFKGHEQAGFGGTLKNMGMGCASRGGKLELHSTSQPKIVDKNCVGCGICVKNCAYDAIHLNEKKIAYIDYDKCVGCGQCIAVCQYNAAQVVWNESSEIMNKKIAEYTYAIVKDKPAFYINFIMNVSPDCDCWSNNDYPIVPDIGIAASFDPVALDMASVDLVKNAPALPGSKIYNSHDFVGEDKFKFVHPNADWEAGLNHAQQIGLGNKEYELIEI
ncbi:4Fe-4S ferredoxin [Marinitoga sp. 1197]|uniref:DUF362 domain-containing protein n=1 Tax=unclassified Marinitoga TaxID=2640159 RepID=UPI000640D97F|nr:MULTISPECIES: DUF362 domain-containing protein [unclassified Marinitoga]KLO21657.1 4Fe-4S ferredoxin [Marinitoga sp. 1155]KLO22977.1 4Fe-4S ferredoxin [Marinitoga sp. 1197]NUU99851.1 4Fe-4S ferredoxin [Marinitoga sp. 1154]